MFQHSLTGRDGSGSGFGSWKTVPAVPVPLSVSGKMVPTVPVSGSGSVPELPCCFSREKHPEFTKTPQISRTGLRIGLPLVWFTGATLKEIPRK